MIVLYYVFAFSFGFINYKQKDALNMLQLFKIIITSKKLKKEYTV